jgi:hypothetical protein
MLDRRTTFQLGLFAIGLIIWGYGQRIDDPSIRLVGIAFFALATMLRFFRRSDTRHAEPEASDETDAE